jgi:hypothetical protein
MWNRAKKTAAFVPAPRAGNNDRNQTLRREGTQAFFVDLREFACGSSLFQSEQFPVPLRALVKHPDAGIELGGSNRA